MGRARGEEGGGGWSRERDKHQCQSSDYRRGPPTSACRHAEGRPSRGSTTSEERLRDRERWGEGDRRGRERGRGGRGGVGEGEREEEEEEERRCRRAAVAPTPVSASEEEFGREREDGAASVGSEGAEGSPIKYLRTVEVGGVNLDR
jgi:hypothetical protein